MIYELDSVVLNTDLPEYGLQEGDIGTVVLVQRGSEGFEVEFVALDGETMAVISLIKPLLEMQNRGEIKIVTFGQLLDEWKTKYNSMPHVRLGTTTTVDENTPGFSTPATFSLAQNFPNPFSANKTCGNSSTTIQFSLPQNEEVSLKIFDALGQEVKTLVQAIWQPVKIILFSMPPACRAAFIFIKSKRRSFRRRARRC